MWPTRYMWPQKVILDRGMEFTKDFIALICNEYGIKQKPTTTRNPQTNAIVERSHQTIGNLICTFKMGTAELDKDNPLGGILNTVMFALWSTYMHHTRLLPCNLYLGEMLW
eukprot:15176707-Ditylum_brightwellii.AAC.1